jgi:hypothetical protein
MNWNCSTITTSFDRLSPAFVVHDSVFSRPSMKIGLPFRKNLLMFSAVFPKAVQSMKDASSFCCPTESVHFRFTPTVNDARAVPAGRNFNSGSLHRLPVIIAFVYDI